MPNAFLDLPTHCQRIECQDGTLLQTDQSSHLLIVTVLPTVIDKISETRLVIEFWRDNFGYAIAFVATMTFSVILNLIMIGRFVMRHQWDSAFMLDLRTRRSAVSAIFMLSLLKFDLMQVWHDYF